MTTKESTTGTTVIDKVKAGALRTKEQIVKIMDENGNGEIDLEDIVIKGLKTPGIAINRDQFLRRQFLKNYPESVVDKAVSESPMKANIPLREVNRIADDVIRFERNCVSGISATLSTPGGIAMAATIPADVLQYYGYLMRVTQKLLYLYGFPQIDVQEKGSKFDDGTMNTLILCFGVMYGVAGANNAVKAMSKALAKGVSKQLIKKALTKGTIYPIVKSVTKWFGIKMTKQIFAKFFEKSIPIAGGIIGGGITYLSFKPCCDKLKATLQDTVLSNPDYKSDPDEEEIIIE